MIHWLYARDDDGLLRDAHKELLRIGIPAIPALNEVLNSDDEVARKLAGSLIDKIRIANQEVEVAEPLPQEKPPESTDPDMSDQMVNVTQMEERLLSIGIDTDVATSRITTLEEVLGKDAASELLSQDDAAGYLTCTDEEFARKIAKLKGVDQEIFGQVTTSGLEEAARSYTCDDEARAQTALKKIEETIHDLVSSSSKAEEGFDYFLNFKNTVCTESLKSSFEKKNPGEIHEELVLGRIINLINAGYEPDQILNAIRYSQGWFGNVDSKDSGCCYGIERLFFKSLSSSPGKQLWHILYDMGADCKARKNIFEVIDADVSPSSALMETMTRLAELTNRFGEAASKRVNYLGANVVTKPLSEIMGDGATDSSQTVDVSKIRELMIKRLTESAGGTDKANALAEAFINKALSSYNQKAFEKASNGADLGEKVFDRLTYYLETESNDGIVIKILETSARYFGEVQDKTFHHTLDQIICGKNTLLGSTNGATLYQELFSNDVELDKIREIFLAIGPDKNLLRLTINRLEKLKNQFDNSDVYVVVNRISANIVSDAETFWTKVELASKSDEELKFCEILEELALPPEIISKVQHTVAGQESLAYSRLNDLREKLDNEAKVRFIVERFSDILIKDDKSFKKEVTKALAAFDLHGLALQSLGADKADEVVTFVIALNYPLPFAHASQKIQEMLNSTEGTEQFKSRPLSEILPEYAIKVAQAKSDAAASEPITEDITRQPVEEADVPNKQKEVVEETMRAVLGDLATSRLIEQVCTEAESAIRQMKIVRDSLGGEDITTDGAKKVIQALEGSVPFDSIIPLIQTQQLSASLEKRGVEPDLAEKIAEELVESCFPISELMARIRDLSFQDCLGSDFGFVMQMHKDPSAFLSSEDEEFESEKSRLKNERLLRVEQIKSGIQNIFTEVTAVRRLTRKQSTYATIEKINSLMEEFGQNLSPDAMKAHSPTILLEDMEQLRTNVANILSKKKHTGKDSVLKNHDLACEILGRPVAGKIFDITPKILSLPGEEFNREILKAIYAHAGISAEPEPNTDEQISRWRELVDKLSLSEAYNMLRADNQLLTCPVREFYRCLDHYVELELLGEILHGRVENLEEILKSVKDTGLAFKNISEIEDDLGHEAAGEFISNNPHVLSMDHIKVVGLLLEKIEESDQAEKEAAKSKEHGNKYEKLLNSWKQKLSYHELGNTNDREVVAHHMASAGLRVPKKRDDFFDLIKEHGNNLPKSLVDSAGSKAFKTNKTEGDDLDSVIQGIIFSDKERKLLRRYTKLDPRVLIRIICKTYHFRGHQSRGKTDIRLEQLEKNIIYAGIKNKRQGLAVLKKLGLVDEHIARKAYVMAAFNPKTDNEGGKLIVEAIIKAFNESAGVAQMAMGE
jgi:hypothetical protein